MSPVDRCSVHFRFSGPALDVDALLAGARPAGAHEVWRRGDPLDGGQRARTSGLQIEIGDFEDAADGVEAVEGFVGAEAAFLAAVGAAATGETLAVLAFALWVRADEPVGVTLEPDLAARLASAGLAVEVTGYPTADDDSPESYGERGT
jgi:hypothetical protein